MIGDHSAGGLSPKQWARKVAGAFERWSADRVVEGNQGGEMVESVLRGSGLRLPVKRVHAMSSKVRRAEPIAAFFETGDARLAGRFPALEDQLTHLVTGGAWQAPPPQPRPGRRDDLGNDRAPARNPERGAQHQKALIAHLNSPHSSSPAFRGRGGTHPEDGG